MALVLLAVGVVGSAVLATYVRASLVSSQQAGFDASSRDAVASMTGNLNRYGDLLQGTAAEVTSMPPTADLNAATLSFVEYARSMQITTRFPGATGLGFIGRFPANQLGALNASLASVGRPPITPGGPSTQYYCPALYMDWEGTSSVPAISGLEFCNTSLLPTQLMEAAATGQQVVVAASSFDPTMAKNIRYVLDRYGFLIIRPVYAPGQPPTTTAERAQTLKGWVLGLFQGNQVIKGIVGQNRSNLGIRLYDSFDPSAKNLVLASPSNGLPHGASSRTVRITSDSDWTFVVTDLRGGLGVSGVVAPLAVFVGGIALSLALFSTFWMMLHRREQAMRMVRRATASLRESESRFRSLALSSPTGIMRTDAEGRCLFANPRMRRIAGVEPDDLLGYGWLSVVHPDDREVLLATLRAAADRRELSTETRLLTPRGNVHWARISAMALEDESGPINSYVVTVEDVTQQVKASEQLAHEALHDSLTGLPNRALFLDRLSQLLMRGDRRPDGLAVLFLDLDRFKVVNDSLGHLAGDQLLVQAASRMKNALRSGETLARLGGDEFTVVIENISSRADAVSVAERLQRALMDPFDLDAGEAFLSASIGIVMVGDRSEGPEALLRDADAAMYWAKERGRNRYEVFSDELRAKAVYRLETETSLRRALERGELTVFYQPQVDLLTDRVSGMEALVRWRHPTRGLLEPAQFISLAEETGLIVPLGETVLKQAVAQFVRWTEELPAFPQGLAVNLSTRQLADPRSKELVAATIEETGIPPEQLCLEVTESVLMSATAPAALRELKALGVRLAIDDFGTGFSSLAYLRRLSVDVLKIDREFVRGLGVDTEDEAIVAATIKLGHTLGLSIVAEGVEIPRQRSVLSSIGADAGQGFLWSRPMPAEDFARWCLDRSQVGLTHAAR